MNSVFSHPILEEVNDNVIQNLASLVPQSNLKKFAQFVKKPRQYYCGFLNESDVKAINSLMDLMCQEGTKSLESEPPEDETEPAPLGSDESLFYKEHLSVPRTQKFRKSPQQMKEYLEDFDERKNKLLKKRITIDKAQSEVERKAGNDLYNAQSYFASLQKYDVSIFMDTSNSLCYSNRAAAYISLSHPQMAISNCLHAIIFDKKSVKPYLRIADAYLDMRKYANALQWYKKLQKIDPNNEDAKNMNILIINKIMNAEFRYKDNKLLIRFFGLANKIRLHARSLDKLQPLIDYQVLVIN